MNHLTKVKLIQNLSEQELSKGIPPSASWHNKYRDSAYIYAGGLNFEMNEGDIVTVFSQFGEIIDCRLIRDKKTGKSHGFAYIAYEDQRSTDLAVDNLNGSTVCGRVLKVDHVHQYKIPREYFEISELEDVENKEIYKPTGPDGKGWGEFRNLDDSDIRELEEAEESEEERKLRNNLVENSNFIMDEDERWEKQFAQIVEDEAVKEKVENEDKKKRKEEKRKRREEKYLKKMLKKQDKKEQREKMLKEVYESYGIKNFNESQINLKVEEKSKSKKKESADSN